MVHAMLQQFIAPPSLFDSRGVVPLGARTVRE
jgi:hypothetical protein